MKRLLTAKQRCAMENYLNPASDTFNNLTQSMIEANYTPKYADHRGWEMVGKDHIKAFMVDYKAELHKNQAITIELQQQKHQRLALLAEAKGDLATATRNQELIGKTIGAYADRVITEPDKLKALTDKENEENRRLAAIRLTEVIGKGHKSA